MDLSRYETIVLHIGGHDVDAKVGPTEFKHKYQSLLSSLADKNCKILISGLLPRRGTNMKPYNSILNELSSQFKAQFIDNHDSFIMALGKLHFEYYQADRVNLKFPGTRLLVQNIKDKCKIIPNVQRSNIHKRSKPVHYRQTRSISFEHYENESRNSTNSEFESPNIYHQLRSICSDCNLSDCSDIEIEPFQDKENSSDQKQNDQDATCMGIIQANSKLPPSSNKISPHNTKPPNCNPYVENIASWSNTLGPEN